MSNSTALDEPIITLGFDTYSDHGPGIFLTRLKQELEQHGWFNQDAPDVWVNLSFTAVPEAIEERRRQGLTKVITRMDGCYCSRWHKIHKPFLLPITPLDDWYSTKKNKQKNKKIAYNLMHYDDIVFQSYFSRDLTQRFVGDTKDGTIIYNGIDLTQFKPVSTSPLKENKKLTVIISHGFMPYHRLHDNMRILARVKQQCDVPVFAFIVGGGDEDAVAYANDIADQSGLVAGEDYQFTGKVPHHELMRFYQQADVMLNLSFRDTCPNVVVEALASGVPVIGTRSGKQQGGVAEMIQLEGDTAGILIDESIPWTYLDSMDVKRMPQAPIQKYADALSTLANDANQLEVYRQGARHVAECRFDIRRTATAYHSFAEVVCSQ